MNLFRRRTSRKNKNRNTLSSSCTSKKLLPFISRGLLLPLLVFFMQQRQITVQYAATSVASSVQTMLNTTKEINYYPANNGWAKMWTQFNPTEMDSDFAKIQGLGFNTVRIILQAVPGAFDYPSPTAVELNRLTQVIVLASNHGLEVHLTLFDLWRQYTDINGSKQWVDAVLKPSAADQRISIIELQNEIDTTNASALTWAQTMIPYLQRRDNGIPVTVSVNHTQQLQSLVKALRTTPPDFWDFHNYEYDGLIYHTLSQVKTIVHHAPLFIGETGYSTYPQSSSSFPYSAPNTQAQEAEQEYYYRLFTYATQSLGLPMAAPWIYSDFAPNAIPYSASAVEDHFGLYRLDGSAKPAAATIASLLAGNPVDTSCNNGFEQSDGQGLPTIWRSYQDSSSGLTANFAWDNTVAHSGTASAKISHSTSSKSGTPSFFVNPVQYTVPGQTYSVSGWYKGLNVTGANTISMAWFDTNGHYLSQAYSPNLPRGTSNWRQATVTAAAPSNAAEMEIHLNSQGNTGSVWFDDIMFTAEASQLKGTP